GRNIIHPTRDMVIKDLIRCGYISAADLAERFGSVNVDPGADPEIVEQTTQPPTITPIFTAAEWNDGEFRKTASVMKMVIDGHAGAGTITMGGYDYHTGDRTTGEARDLRAGRCMGACLDYARRRGVPLLMYVFSDGSVFSNGTTDGTGKGVWTGDNSGTAGAFMLLYDPNAAGRPVVNTNQIGWYSRQGAVVTASSPAANNVNQLVNTVLLNYMSASGMLEASTAPFFNIFNQLGFNHGLGDTASIDRLTALRPIAPPPPPPGP
ncbi:MAG: general secretion pathway protein GspF, partial [Gammaproteobacteria bacterium]|nr:general secretion pathway protein GspF [Gammaproteobacteria bacterium]